MSAAADLMRDLNARAGSRLVRHGRAWYVERADGTLEQRAYAGITVHGLFRENRLNGAGDRPDEFASPLHAADGRRA